MVNKTSRIVQVYVRHKRPTTKMKGTYMSRKDPYVNARMTLWAITELGDHVWLDTRRGLDTRRVEAKVQEYEAEHKDKVGRIIEYTSTGFIRGYKN
jgi:hypothetical protein